MSVSVCVRERERERERERGLADKWSDDLTLKRPREVSLII